MQNIDPMKFLKTNSTSSNNLKTDTDERILPELKGHLKPKVNDKSKLEFEPKLSKLEEKQS